MVVGMLDHQTGTRDIFELPALDRRWRPVAAVAVLSAASMSGIPLLFGFIAKEAAYEAVIDSGLGNAAVVLGGLVAGAALTLAYSLPHVRGAFVPTHPPAPPR